MQTEVDYNNDAYGDRIDKSLDAIGGGTFVVTRFAYDGWKTGPQKSFVGNENRDVWADLDGSNNLQTRYVRGNEIDQPLARIGADTNAYRYLTDRMGSIRDVTDNSGVVKDTLCYDGWGAIVTGHLAAPAAEPDRGRHAGCPSFTVRSGGRGSPAERYALLFSTCE